jgi:hypothetical protein
MAFDMKTTEKTSCIEATPVTGHAPSLLPPGRWRLVWHDEFDGDRLDDTKWGYRTCFWGRRALWFATPEDGAVEVRDSLCRLKLTKRPDGQFVTPQLQTGEMVWDTPHVEGRKKFWPLPKRQPAKFVHRYGYYECRCRLQQMPDWWTAFWMQSPTQGCSLDPAHAGVEHDIMESFRPGQIIPHAFHANGYGADHLCFTVPPQPAGMSRHEWNKAGAVHLDKTVFHTFGMLWEPDGYTFYIDGAQHGDKAGGGPGEAVSHVPEFILISAEAKDFRQNMMTGPAAPGLEAALAAGDDFLVDYVRVFDPEE